MRKAEQKQSTEETQQALVFSSPLRQEIQTACEQLQNGEGQEDITINREVELWLSR